MIRVSPEAAGRAVVNRPSARVTAKIPGATLLTFVLTALLIVPLIGDPARVPRIAVPLTITDTGAVPSPSPSSHGICTLIWLGETKWIGAKNPLTNTVTPPNVVGIGVEVACCVVLVKPDP